MDIERIILDDILILHLFLAEYTDTEYTDNIAYGKRRPRQRVISRIARLLEAVVPSDAHAWLEIFEDCSLRKLQPEGYNGTSDRH